MCIGVLFLFIFCYELRCQSSSSGGLPQFWHMQSMVRRTAPTSITVTARARKINATIVKASAASESNSFATPKPVVDVIVVTLRMLLQSVPRSRAHRHHQKKTHSSSYCGWTRTIMRPSPTSLRDEKLYESTMCASASGTKNCASPPFFSGGRARDEKLYECAFPAMCHYISGTSSAHIGLFFFLFFSANSVVGSRKWHRRL